MSRKNHVAVLFVLLVFTVFCAVRHRNVPGTDMSSSYYGCRVLAAGQEEHLYSRDPEVYDHLKDPVWERLAATSGYSEHESLHPYVQTPLWAFLLEPLCTRMNFPHFNAVMIAIVSICFSLTLWTVARYWAPQLYRPGWMLLICGLLYASQAYKYAMLLSQTHIIFVLLTVIALVCGRRGAPLWAGVWLALAAAIKITPAFLVVYWLVNRQTKAALSFFVSSVVLHAITIAITGPALMMQYVHNLSAISNILLVSWNNQSFAALALGSRFDVKELVHWRAFPLPPFIKTLSLLLTLGFTIAGGLLDRSMDDRAARDNKPSAPPYGAVIAMLAATMFAPIAWVHYYILLMIPVMLILAALRTKASWPLFLLSVFIIGLNFEFDTGSILDLRVPTTSLMRVQFFAGVLAIWALALLSFRVRTHRTETAEKAMEIVEVTGLTQAGSRSAFTDIASAIKTGTGDCG